MSQSPYTDQLRVALQTFVNRDGRLDAALTKIKESTEKVQELQAAANVNVALGNPPRPALPPGDVLVIIERAAEQARQEAELLDEAVKRWKQNAEAGGCFYTGAIVTAIFAVLSFFYGVIENFDADFILASLVVAISTALIWLAIRSVRARPSNIAEHAREARLALHNAQQLIASARQQTLDQLAAGLPAVPPGLPTQPWTANAWNQWQPLPPGAARGGDFRLGRLTITQGYEPPFLTGLLGARGLAFAATGEGRARAAAAVQSLVLRLLAATPPGAVRLTFIDPIGRGNNAAGFMHLKDHLPDMISGQAWAEGRQIEQALADLTNQMDNLIQQYLRNVYPTIAEYNAQAAVPEPYRLLVVFDFPANFNETAARYLVSLAENGPRCGIYPLVLYDSSKPTPYGFDVDDLLGACTVIEQDGGRFVWNDGIFGRFPVTFDQPPPEALFNRIVTAIGAGAKQASVVEVKYDQVMPRPEMWWRGSTRDDFSVPLGPAGARRVQQLTLGRGTAHHALLAGRTGAGKSNLLHVLIVSAALAYPPQELELYLIDFKEGVEFKPYAVNFLPHARVVAIESEREFGLSVLEGLDRELERRGRLFRERGTQSLRDFRERYPNEPLPRILLVVDEFQVFFAEDDALGARCGALLDKLVRQGRSFGIHLLLGSQTLAGAYALARGTMEQMGVRVALQCSEADSRVILAEDNPAARLLSRPGEAIYNAKNGLIEGNENFQVAWLPDSERAQALGQVREMARRAQYRRSQPLIVFEGRAAARLNKNMRLSALLNTPGWPAPDRKALAWLGEPVAIADPTAAAFRRQSSSNLLIVARDEELATGMMLAALLSLAAQLPPQRARFYILDFSAVDGPAADVLAGLPRRMPHGVVHVRRNKMAATLAEVYHAVQQRLECDEATVARRASLFMIIHGLHRARDLRQDDADSYNYNFNDPQPAAPGLAQQLAAIVKDGPEMGVHTIVWADSVPNLLRAVDRRLLREFDMRVATQMSADDSAALLDNDPRAGQLRDFRGYLYSQEDSRLEKFSPYGLPAPEWLDDYSQRLHNRQP